MAKIFVNMLNCETEFDRLHVIILSNLGGSRVIKNEIAAQRNLW